MKGFQTPHSSFKRSLFRQPSLVEGSLKPSPTRRPTRTNPAPISTSDLAPVPISITTTSRNTTTNGTDNSSQQGFFYRLIGKKPSPQKAVIVDTITSEIGKAVEIKSQYRNKSNYIYEIDEDNDYDLNYDDDLESNSSFSTPTPLTPSINNNNNTNGNPTWSRVRRGSKNIIGYNDSEYEMRNRSRTNTNTTTNTEELSLLKNSNGTYGTIKK